MSNDNSSAAAGSGYHTQAPLLGPSVTTTGFGDAVFRFLDVVAASIGASVAAWRRTRAINATAAILRELDDRQLRDIGVHRDAIREVARAAADRRDAPLWRCR